MSNNPSCNDIIDAQNRTYGPITCGNDVATAWRKMPYRRLGRAIASTIGLGLGGEPGTAAAALGNYFLQHRKTSCPELLAECIQPTKEFMMVMKRVSHLIVGDPYRRAELDARLLADQSHDAIGKAMELGEIVVTAYAFAAMDVNYRLESFAWICRAAIGWDYNSELPSTAVPTLWRIVGYRHGIGALDCIKQAIPREILERDGMDAYLMPDVALAADVKEWIASLRVPLYRLSCALRTWQSTDGVPLVTDSPILNLTRSFLVNVA